MSAVMWISISPVQMRTSVVGSAKWGTQVGVTSRPSPRALPGELRALVAVALRAFSRAPGRLCQRYISMLPRQFGLGKGEERQHEDFGVPEDVVAVAEAAQGLGADGGAIGEARGGDEQLEDVEAQRKLGLVVALDQHVGGLPRLVPAASFAFAPGRVAFDAVRSTPSPGQACAGSARIRPGHDARHTWSERRTVRPAPAAARRSIVGWPSSRRARYCLRLGRCGRIALLVGQSAG